MIRNLRGSVSVTGTFWPAPTVTFSPGPRSIAVTGLPSSQLEPVRSQPVGTFSATLYPLPGARFENVCVSPLCRLKLDGLRPPPAVNGKLVVVSLAGLVTFLILIVPRALFVNVQVTVSPALTSMFVTALPSSHVELWRSQPDGTGSARV